MKRMYSRPQTLVVYVAPVLMTGTSNSITSEMESTGTSINYGGVDVEGELIPAIRRNDNSFDDEED